MPYTKNDFPDAMKNLEEDIREKALEITNALLEEGYEEGRAIAIGIAEAREWVKTRARDVKAQITHHLVPHDKGWAITKEDANHPSFFFDTKEDALDKVKELVKVEPYKIMIHDQDGQFQRIY